jgi:phenylacetate-coenzyme A ligase PaaK-like adenylate-forming protein
MRNLTVGIKGESMALINLFNSLLRNYGKQEVDSMEEWKEISKSSKSELREIIPKNFSELRITSGSSGKPLFIFYSSKSVESFVRRTIRSLEMSKVNKDDIVLNLFAYGNFIPGSMYERACLLSGIPVLPLGAPNTYPKEKIMEVIIKIKPSVWLSVPSYALGLLQAMKDLKLEKCMPKKVLVAGEKLLDSYIEKFKELGVEVINHFGLTECPAIGVSKPGDPKLIEVINDGIFAESVETENGLELLITDLNNFSTPIIRYNTFDILDRVKYNSDGSLMEFELKGRTDDLIKLQGLLVSKNQIKDILSKFSEDFIVNISIKDNRDFVEIILPSRIKDKESEILDKLDFIKAKKTVVYQDIVEVQKTSSYKLRNINDKRN